MTETVARARIRGWWVDAALIAGFVALTAALINGHLLGLDQWVADWAFGHRPRALYVIARVFNLLGQGGQFLIPVSVILAAVLIRRTRSVRPLLPPIAAFVLAYLTIGPLKIWADRAAPAFTGPEKTVMFNPYAAGAKAISYPSGHMANSLVWYAAMAVLIAALLRRPLSRWESFAVRYLPAVILFCTTVYTGFHWLTDSVAGLLLGLFLARLMDRILWDSVPLRSLRGWSRPAGLSAAK